MDLTLALDAVTAPVVAPDTRAPGSDPNDATSVAFASLLASLVAVTTPIPDPTEAVVAEAGAAPVAEPVAAAPALALDAPIALALAPAAAPIGIDDAPADPAAEPAPTLLAQPEAAAAAATPQRRLDELTRDVPVEDLEADAPDVPAAKHEPPARVQAAALPVPGAAVAASATSSSPATRPAGGDPDEKPDSSVTAVTHPSAHETPAAPAREILKPEIVTGPRPSAPATPVQQVVRAVAPLRRLADGTHSVVLELHPAELGAVRVELSLDRGVVHLGLRADVEGTGQLLRAALPELRSQLVAAGLTAGRVAVDAGQSGRGGDGQPPSWRTDPDRARRRPGADHAEVVDELVPTAYSTADYGRVDVLL